MKTLVWLLALALPIQNLAVVAVELRGPAHFHVDAESVNDALRHGHSHVHVEHHFHAANEGAVEVDDSHHHDAEALEANKRASFNAFDTLTLATSLRDVLQPGTGAIAAGDGRESPPPFPGRLERPPAPSPARLLS